jgi:Na+-transporting NADH:ubiquinone oxidoreductase subunit NqrB
MDVTSTETATLAIWTIARFAALAVLATEALFFYMRRRDPQPRPASAVFWALIPALLLAGLCFWCTVSVSSSGAPSGTSAVAQLAR